MAAVAGPCRLLPSRAKPGGQSNREHPKGGRVTDEFDAIVIGAGMAGLCCAGELVAQGARPLLVAESKEVGVAFKPLMVAGNTGLMQMATVQLLWGGGRWVNLVRRLNVPVSTPFGLRPVGYDLALSGFSDAPQFLPPLPQFIGSARRMVEFFQSVFPMASECAGELERILDLGLQMSLESYSACRTCS